MRLRVYTLSGALLVLLSTGCGLTVTAERAPDPVAIDDTEFGRSEEVNSITLTVWDQFGRDTERVLIDEMNARFESSHPGVKINRVVKSFDDLKATVLSTLSDRNGADIGQVNQGADMRAAARSNLLLDLTPYLAKYHWDARFSPDLLARNSVSPGGSEMGSGNLLGISPTAELVGVYYNKEKFEKLGMIPPKTFAEFEALLARARAAHETPLMLGNLEGWPGIHVFSAIQHILLPDRTWLDDFIYGRGHVSFYIDENIRAAAKVQDWVHEGYFSDGFETISYDDSWKRFAGGEGVMLLGGSWLSADMVRIGGEKFGFFLLPPLREGGQALAVGGVGLPFSIRNGTKNADIAVEYLNWMVSPHSGEMWLDHGVLPAMPVHASRIPVGTLLGDIVSTYGSVSADNLLGHFIDWAGPTMYDVMGTATSDLMALEISPRDFAARIQVEYSATQTKDHKAASLRRSLRPVN